MKTLATTSLLALAALLPAQAAFTYVDATDTSSGNTTLSDGTPFDANDGTGGTTWRQRDNVAFGSGGTVFEGVEPSPTIVTTLTGLTPGTSYEIVVHFWDPDSDVEDWNIQAGFTVGSLATYSRAADDVPGGIASPLSSSLTYDTAPDLFAAGGRSSFAAMLGTATANGSGEIQVFLDDIGSTDVNQRTWYDGVSYQVVPEPTTALLGLLGFAGLLRRRR